MKKILIISLDNLGDTLMAASLAKPVGQALGECQITVWAKAYCSKILELCPYVDQVFESDPPWTGSPGLPKGNLRKFAAAFLRIAKERFDQAIILHTDWRRSLSAFLARIPVRIGFDQKRGRPFLTQSFPPPSEDEHILDAYARLLRDSLRVAKPRLRCEIRIPRPRPLRYVAAIHPFSGDPRKNWPLDLWEELGRELLEETGLGLLMVVSPYEFSAYRRGIQKMKQRLGDCLVLSCEVAANLLELAYEMASARIFVGNDSGPLHIACAAGIPSLGLFSPENLRSAPRGRGPLTVIARFPVRSIHLPEVLKASRDLSGGMVRQP